MLQVTQPFNAQKVLEEVSKMEAHRAAGVTANSLEQGTVINDDQQRVTNKSVLSPQQQLQLMQQSTDQSQQIQGALAAYAQQQQAISQLLTLQRQQQLSQTQQQPLAMQQLVQFQQQLQQTNPVQRQSPMMKAVSMPPTTIMQNTLATSFKQESTAPSAIPRGRERLTIEFRTPLLHKYWRNDRRNLQCFPFCPKFKDYKHHKEYVTETDTAKSYCNQPYDIAVKFEDPELATNPKLRIFGRFREVYNTASLANGTSSFIPKTSSEKTEKADTDKEITDESATLQNDRSAGSPYWDTMSSSVKEDIPLYQAGNVINEENAPAEGGISKPFPYRAQYLMVSKDEVTFRFSPSHWKYTSKLPKTRIAIMNTTHCFEVVVAIEKTKEGTESVKASKELEIIAVASSPAFKIANTRSLLRLKRQQHSNSQTAATSAERTAGPRAFPLSVFQGLPGFSSATQGNVTSPYALPMQSMQQQLHLQQLQSMQQYPQLQILQQSPQLVNNMQSYAPSSFSTSQENSNKRIKTVEYLNPGPQGNVQQSQFANQMQQSNFAMMQPKISGYAQLQPSQLQLLAALQQQQAAAVNTNTLLQRQQLLQQQPGGQPQPAQVKFESQSSNASMQPPSA